VRLSRSVSLHAPWLSRRLEPPRSL
jgi:hypothetical protein